MFLWNLDGYGILRPHIDYIEIGSTESPATLFKTLRMKELKAASHKFHIEKYEDNPVYFSKIMITGTANGNPFWLLNQWRDYLGWHRLTHVEVTYDRQGWSVPVEQDNLVKLMKTIRKLHHSRGKINVVRTKPGAELKKGMIAGDTFYFEHENSTVRLRAYCRYGKQLGGQFAENPLTRLEAVLTKSAIKTYMGGFEIRHLLEADLYKFLEECLRFEIPNYERIGAHLLPCRRLKPNQTLQEARSTTTPHRSIKSLERSRYARKAAVWHLREWALQNAHRFADQEQAQEICLNSPAEIRAFLKDYQERSQGRAGLTPYMIDQCFNPIPLIGEAGV